MRSRFVKMKYYISNCCKEFWQDNKLSIMILLCSAIGGLVLGIVLTANSEMERVSDNYIIQLRDNDFKIFASYLKVIFIYLLVFAVVYCSGLHKFAKCLPYIVIVIIGYRLGCKSVLLIICDKLTGVICLLSYTIWLYLIIIVDVMILTSIVRRVTNGCSAGCIRINRDMLKTFGLILAINAIVLIIICICVPSIVRLIVVV